MISIKAFNLLNKIITKGAYNKEELILDINDFLTLNTLTAEQVGYLLELIEANPSTETSYNIQTSDNIYMLLSRQIERQAYSLEVIQSMITDFRITNSIDRRQFANLIVLIKEKYCIEEIIEDAVEDEVPEI